MTPFDSPSLEWVSSKDAMGIVRPKDQKPLLLRLIVNQSNFCR